MGSAFSLPTAHMSSTIAIRAPDPPKKKCDVSTSVEYETAPHEKSPKIVNPGPLEEMSKKCKDIFPTNFDGAKFVINRGFSNRFQISHTMNLSATTPNGYRLGGTYVGTKQISPTEAYPVILGDVDPNGTFNANIIHQLTPKMKYKFVCQCNILKITAIQLAADFKKDAHCTTLMVGSPNPFKGEGVAVAQYLQSLTSKFALGSELVYQKSDRIPGGELTAVSAAAKYSMADSEISATFGGGGLRFYYHKQASKQLQIGIEVETSFKTEESTCTLGYQVDLPAPDLTFKAMADTNWNIGCVLEKRLEHLPFTLAISCSLNHLRPTSFLLGCGFIIG